jgi:pilus assembly protein CpaF
MMALRDTLHRRLLADPFDPFTVERDELRARLAHMLREEEPLLASEAADAVLDDLVHDVGGLGPLEPLLADASVTEVLVNGPDRVYVERAGVLARVDCAIDASTIVRVAERVVAPLGLRLDRASPMVDARFSDGSRLHAVLPPLAPDGPCLCIRRFLRRPVPLDAFGLDAAARDFVTALVRGGWNLVVCAIDSNERIVTIEETAELRLDQPHVVRLEARPANAEGVGAVSVRDLVRSALRMRPDRLVVGEVRGAEALDMLQACNTGHDGSLSTVHANSALDALARLETLALYAGIGLPLPAIRAQIATAIDAVVHVARARDGRRHVVAVAEVDGARTLRVRPLLERRDAQWVAPAPPKRPARRVHVDIEKEWHSCARSLSH